MNERRIKLLTRELIEACGGLAEAALASRYDVTRLSRCQTPSTPDFLAIDVVWKLEAYCGKPIISQALVEEAPQHAAPVNAADEAAEVTEAAAGLQTFVRLAVKDGQLSPRERQDGLRLVDALKEEIRDVEAVLTGDNAA